MHNIGFPYTADCTAQVLILGSMPSRKSLAAAQYYAHPQNAFWPIMAELFNFDGELNYETRLIRLHINHVALWDVAHQCIRPGSMDHAIETKSVIANDFVSLFIDHPHIHTIFFNGRKAEQLYRNIAWPKLPGAYQSMQQHLLPSTSPANARITRAQKLAAWKIVTETLERD